MSYLIVLLALAGPAHAQLVHRWTSTGNLSGECHQVSVSGAQDFVQKVKPEDCKPDETTLLWSDGRCYEIDSATKGKSFAQKVESTRCAPEGSLHAFDPARQECFLVGPAGTGFKTKLELRDCRPEESEIELHFVASPSGLGGECFERHKTEGEARWRKRVELRTCRPAQTQFAWRPTGELSGDCWELSLEGAAKYVAKIGPSACRPEKVRFVFKAKNEKSGDCFEVDAETEGQRYAARAPLERCRPE